MGEWSDGWGSGVMDGKCPVQYLVHVFSEPLRWIIIG